MTIKKYMQELAEHNNEPEETRHELEARLVEFYDEEATMRIGRLFEDTKQKFEALGGSWEEAKKKGI